MKVVRLLTVFILAGLLTGCDKIEAIEHDVGVVKAYLRALTPPDGCLPAGTPQSRLCVHKLKEVQEFKGGPKGIYIGHVAKEDVESGYKSCMDVREKILKDHPGSSFTCQDPAHYPYDWHGFKIYGDVPDLSDKNKVHTFLNVPGTEFLRVGTADEAEVKNP